MFFYKTVLLITYFYYRSFHSRCLNNVPTNNGQKKHLSLGDKLPGQVYNADKQCEMVFGAGYRQCPFAVVCTIYFQ